MQEQEPIREMPSEPTSEACRHHALNQRVRTALARQQWLDPVADKVQDAVGNAMAAAGSTATDFLHGTWLRHPLHPVLSDGPIGAWTTAMAFDILDLGREEPKYGAAADAAVALGVAMAVPTALTGTADWRHTYSLPRRVGLVHAVLNIAGLLCQIAALAFRLRGSRRRGVALSAFGCLSTTLAAWLGGTLVYEERVGVDHSGAKAGPTEFVPVYPEAQLREGTLQKVNAKGVSVLLCRHKGKIFAMGETCAHQGGPLSQGRVEGDNVVCPWHGSHFRLRDGTLVHGPSAFDQPCYEVRVHEGQIEVRHSP